MEINTVSDQVTDLPEELSWLEPHIQKVATKRLKGIYFLIYKGQIQYIGKSIDVYGRINQHSTDKTKRFDTVYYLPIHDSFLYMLEHFEKDFIRFFKPPGNVQFNDGCSYERDTMENIETICCGPKIKHKKKAKTIKKAKAAADEKRKLYDTEMELIFNRHIAQKVEDKIKKEYQPMIRTLKQNIDQLRHVRDFYAVSKKLEPVPDLVA